ncbi:hypothetical protein CMUS01_13863 [Colletotrichum musicola]|uniref:Uncharacterized protein n=1 Tax=Colletotrichum musicola TaxID=2175873 RepID=A0A8H6J8N9_9PEZI|nr:hypothetical protein CMUS01_13863 [Colletotrichum musicola]
MEDDTSDVDFIDYEDPNLRWDNDGYPILPCQLRDPYEILHNEWGYRCLRKTYPGGVGPHHMPNEIILEIMQFVLLWAMKCETPQHLDITHEYMSKYWMSLTERRTYTISRPPLTGKEHLRRFKRIHGIVHLSHYVRAAVLQKYMLFPVQLADTLRGHEEFIVAIPDIDIIIMPRIDINSLLDPQDMRELFRRLTTLHFDINSFLKPKDAELLLYMFALMPALRTVELQCYCLRPGLGEWGEEWRAIDEDVFPELAEWEEDNGGCFHAMWKPFANRGVELVTTDRRESKRRFTLMSTREGILMKPVQVPKPAPWKMPIRVQWPTNTANAANAANAANVAVAANIADPSGSDEFSSVAIAEARIKKCHEAYQAMVFGQTMDSMSQGMESQVRMGEKS